jgi:hypothetical protein
MRKEETERREYVKGQEKEDEKRKVQEGKGGGKEKIRR